MGKSGDRKSAGGGSRLLRPQERLGFRGLLCLIAASNALIPFSMDMYTPAVPTLPGYFHTTAPVVNLTILGFFLSFAIGILVFGPVSDARGRRPVLLGGFCAYVLGGALCALSPTIWVLIASRVVQALGAGAIVSVTTALVKDSFEPESRAKILAVLQMLQVVGPVAAPLLGGAILLVGTWHTTFWALAAIGAVCLALATRLQETVPPGERVQGPPLASLSRLAVVARHKGFDAFLGVMSLFSLPFMAYIAVASYVYVDRFGLTQQQYTYFFAATAAFTVLGPVLYLRFGHLLKPRVMIGALVAAAACAGALVLAEGVRSPFLFCGCFLVFAVCEAVIRPCSINILLSQHERDTGSASALINFTANVFGAAGMALIMLPWPGYVEGLGALILICMLAALVLLVLIQRVGALRVAGLTR